MINHDCKGDECEVCELHARVTYYEQKFKEFEHAKLKAPDPFKDGEKSHADMRALLNQYRILNVGAQALARLIEEGTLDITGIRRFVSAQRLTWDNISDEDAYILMTLNQEFAQQWALALNERTMKPTIKRELINKTHTKLKQAEKIREGKLNSNGSEIKQAKPVLTNWEKRLRDTMKIYKVDQATAVSMMQAMGAIPEGEARDLKSLGVLWITKNSNALALGRLGGLKGGKARALKLSPKRRKAIAQNAAKIRWQS